MTSSTGIEPWLRQILRCPLCHGLLTDRVDVRDDASGAPHAAFLDCAGACAESGTGRSYRIEDGIPVLLVDEAVASPTCP